MKLQKKDANGSKTYNVEECLDKIVGINGTTSEINQKLGKIEEKYTAVEKAKVNAIPENPKYTDTVYDDTTIKHDVSVLFDQLTADRGRITTIESKLSGNDSVTIGNLTTKGEVEIYGAIPHIDFHYNNSTDDYTSRIIENAAGAIDILAPNGIKLNGSNLKYDDTAIKNRLTAIENKENVTLTANTARISNVSYTAKYFPLLGMVFVRIYGKINAALNVGYDYNLFTINSRVPDSSAALSVKCGKNAMAVAKTSSSGSAIQIHPLESGINNYDVYITGFWFV